MTRRSGRRDAALAVVGALALCCASATSAGGVAQADASDFRYAIGAVAHNRGEADSTWRTGIGVVNRSGGEATVNLTYTSASDSQSRQLALSDGAALEWLDVLEELFDVVPAKETQGVIHVVSDRALVITARTYNQGPAGTFGQYIPALRESDTIGFGQTGVLPHLKKNAAFRTNLGLVNFSPATCSVVVDLFGAAGAQLGASKPLSVGAGGWFQQGDIFGAVGVDGAAAIAYATVEVQTPGCRVWAYGSVVDEGTNDPVTIPVLVDPGAVAAEMPAAPDLIGRSGAGDALRRPIEIQPSTGPGRGVSARGAVAAGEVVFQDDFEAGLPGSWLVVSYSDTGWGPSTQRAAGGSSSAWCAGGGAAPAAPGTNYAPKMETWLLQGPFDLSDAEEVTLSFDAWYRSQAGEDLFWALVVLEGEFPVGLKFSGDSSSESNFGSAAGGWGSAVLDFADLSTYIDPFVSDVYIAFLFESDESLEMEGAYVDNVVLRKVSAVPSCTVTCTAVVPAAVTLDEPAQFAAQVTLTDCTSAASFDWDFGDGSAHSAAQDTEHQYDAPGSYGWKLTVSADGKSCSRSGTIVVSPAGETFVTILPGMAHNGGQGGSQWRSDAAFVNRTSSVAHLALVYLAAGGTTTTRTATLGSGDTIEWRNILESLFGFSRTSESQGTVRITSDAPLSITARTYNQSDAGSFGQYLPALTIASAGAAGLDGPGEAWVPEVAPGQVAVIPQLKNNATFRCNVGAANLSAEPCNVRVTLFDASGTMLGSPVGLSPAGGRWIQRNDVFGAAGVTASVDVAYATVEVLTPECTVWVYASVVDNGTSDPTTIPALVR